MISNTSAAVLNELISKPLAKASSYNPLYKQPVDINMARIQIMADPFMNNGEKLKATGLFNAAEHMGYARNGVTDAKGLASTILTTGRDALAADFAGKMVGSLFSLPTETTNTLRGGGVMYTTLKGLDII